MYKVIVAGSRTFNDYNLLKTTLISFLKGKRPSEIQIVSGGARGADKLGEKFAKQYNCKLRLFPADWENHGRGAGFRRNSEMSKYGDACVVFMRKEGSKGSQHMINLAKKEGLGLLVITY